MELYTEDEINIESSPSKVWDALIDPELTKKYMFGCEVISDWKEGNPVIWKGAEDGVVYVSGQLLAFEPGKKLSFTIIDPNADYADIPENHLIATYTLTPNGSTTRLHVIQGDYATVADGDKRYQESISQGGWQPVLEAIKKLLEG